MWLALLFLYCFQDLQLTEHIRGLQVDLGMKLDTVGQVWSTQLASPRNRYTNTSLLTATNALIVVQSYAATHSSARAAPEPVYEHKLTECSHRIGKHTHHQTAADSSACVASEPIYEHRPTERSCLLRAFNDIETAHPHMAADPQLASPRIRYTNTADSSAYVAS